MKKIFTARHLSLLLLLSLFGGSKAQATGYDDESRCFGRDYECSCNPLNCGSFGLQFQGGVYPIVWTRRGDISLINCGLITPPVVSPVVTVAEIPKFSKLFSTPWTVGGKITYAMSDNTDIFVEFNYAQSKSKDCATATTTGCASNNACAPLVSPAITLNLGVGKYKLFNAYFGARYYFDRWCDRVSFFVGEKIGLVAHKRSEARQFATIPFVTSGSCAASCGTTSCNDFFSRNTVVSGGVQVGLDFCFCGNWALVLTGEVVASCGPRTNGNFVLNTADALDLGGSNLLFGGIGTELSFPVTLGVKYNF